MSPTRAAALLLVALAVAPALAMADPRDWPSARFRDSPRDVPPCTCRGPAVEVEVGGEACLSAEDGGGRLARCVMAGNVTSWRMGEARCPLPLTN